MPLSAGAFWRPWISTRVPAASPSSVGSSKVSCSSDGSSSDGGGSFGGGDFRLEKQMIIKTMSKANNGSSEGNLISGEALEEAWTGPMSGCAPSLRVPLPLQDFILERRTCCSSKKSVGSLRSLSDAPD